MPRLRPVVKNDKLCDEGLNDVLVARYTLALSTGL